jgi:Toastrack DUF4097
MRCQDSRSIRLWGIPAWALVAVLLVACAAVPARSAQGSFDRTLKVTGPVDLDVHTGSGSITVRAGQTGTVRVHGNIRTSGDWFSGSDGEQQVRALEAHPPIAQTGNVIRIGRMEDPALRRNVSISYELEVPVSTRLNASSGSGNETLEGIRGPLDARTGSGSLQIARIGGAVHAHAGSGNIELDSVQGAVRADTGSGSIRGTGIAGGIVASTGSGNVRLQQSAPGGVRAETGSGSLELTGINGPLRAHAGSGNISVEGKLGGDWYLQTGSGSVTVRLPSDAAFDVYAHTGSGSVSTGLPLTVQGRIDRHHLEGKVHGGGFRLDLSTGSGSIRIE